MIPLLSIAICTHNRSKYLINCLRSAIKQVKRVDRRDIEINIFDSSKEMNGRISKIIEGSMLENIRYIMIKASGIAESRNIALAKSRGSYIAFLDDDVIVMKDWLNNIFEYIEFNPRINLFGGPAYAIIEKGYKRPSWLPTAYNNLYHGVKTKEINYKNEWLIAANLIIKRKPIIVAGGFNNTLGMSGNIIGYGEETDLIIRMKRMGSPTIYVPNIAVRHVIRKEKLKFLWHIKSQLAIGRSLATTLNEENNYKFILKYYGLSPLYAISSLLNIKKYSFPENLYYSSEQLFPLLGACYSYFMTKFHNHS